jgi:predicted porin
LSGFDFDVEAAYQMGNVDGQPNACPFGFGDDADVEYDAFAANAVLGYTFDMAWQPRVYGKFAYLEGGDRDESCWSNDRTLPFNRLFSDVDYSAFLDNQSNLTNLIFYALGVQVMPTECVSLQLMGAYLDIDKTYGEEGDLGWEVGVSGTYHYSEDLAFSAGYSHFFGSDWDATEDCPVYDWDGDFSSDFDYFWMQTEIAF